MEKTFTRWEKFGCVQFKEEKSQITINLGKGNGLDIFNQSIKEINLKKEQKNERNRFKKIRRFNDKKL